MKFSWMFSVLTCDANGVVLFVDWRRALKTGKFTAEAYGQLQLSPPRGPIKAFSELSQSDIESWAVAELGSRLEEIDAGLRFQIEEQQAPKRIKRQPPWIKPPKVP